MDNGEISAEALEAFEDIWREWRFEGDNYEMMEAGGTPDLPSLATRVLAWARALDAK